MGDGHSHSRPPPRPAREELTVSLTRGHHHPEEVVSSTGGAWAVFDLLCLGILLTAAVVYLTGAWRTRGVWPWWRTGLWLAGLVCAGTALVGPLALAGRAGFTGHMVGHLLLGMIAPLLLVLAAPVSLALRALPAPGARRLSGVLRSLPVRVVSHPATAAVLNAGGLWLLYVSPLYHLMHSSVWVHGLVHAHVLLAGTVFTAAIISPDPNPHRASLRLRAVVMVAFIAAHSILAKWLYAHPPAGVDTADARMGAQLMYYGGDVVDVVLLVLLFLGWYPLTRPRPHSRHGGRTPARGVLLRANPRTDPRPVPDPHPPRQESLP